MTSIDRHYYFHKINGKSDATQILFEQITCKFLQDFPLIDPDEDLEVILIGESITEEHVKSQARIDLTIKIVGDEDELDEEDARIIGRKLESVRSLIRLPASDKKRKKPKDRGRRLLKADKSGWRSLLLTARFASTKN